MSDSYTSFREHFSHNEILRPWWRPRLRTNISYNWIGSKRLSMGFRVARTSRPRDPIAVASFRLGFYLRVSYLLSRSV